MRDALIAHGLPVKDVYPAGTHALAFFDGACRGNPGRMAGGAILHMNGETMILKGKVAHGTNNEAEYRGALLALESALNAGARSITLCGDSKVIINQLKGEFKVKAANLQSLYEEAQNMMLKFDAADLQWVPRDENKAADLAANLALDNHEILGMQV